MSTHTTPSRGWEPTAASPRLLPVAPGLAKMYMKLFVNRLSYCEQSPFGDHRYHRPKHPELKALAGRRAAAEMPDQKWGSPPHTELANEIYFELVKERKLDSPFRSLTEKTIEQHLAGQVTVNLYAINPQTQCCKWVAIDADYDTEQAKRDLAKLRKELLFDNVFAVQEYSRRGGHLWILCEEPLPAKQCRLFIYNLALRLGVPIKGSRFADEGIEIFPKQDFLEPGALGNGIRAPLGIHRKNDTRYWFVDIGPLTLESQINALSQLPKLTAEQLNGLTYKMPPPPQWEEVDDYPIALPMRSSGRRAEDKRPFSIYDHISIAHARSVGGKDYFVQCSSCRLAGKDTSKDNLGVGKPNGPRHGYYHCHAGCSTDDIRNALGYPRSQQFRKR
jgi:TOTE conflict system, Archaeo-Eukaryotic Primase domain